MAQDALSGLLATRDWLMADGATGTNLFNMGLSSGEPPEFWNMDKPDNIRSALPIGGRGGVGHFPDQHLRRQCGPAETALGAGPGARVEPRRAPPWAARSPMRRAARSWWQARSGRRARSFEPMGNLTHALAVEIFHEQAEGLKEGGADVLWVETMSASEEYAAAAEAAALAGMPWCGTMSFDTAGRTMMGITSATLAELVETLPNPPIAFGANCGVGASDLMRTVLGFAAAGSTRPIIAKGNAGIPKYHEGHIHYDGTPELMAEYAVLARDAGVQDHRRLLRHDARASEGHARGAGKPPARAAPDGRRHPRQAGCVFVGLGRHGRHLGRSQARTARAARDSGQKFFEDFCKFLRRNLDVAQNRTTGPLAVAAA